eukprot:1418900-Amphidinium_carterae.1
MSCTFIQIPGVSRRVPLAIRPLTTIGPSWRVRSTPVPQAAHVIMLAALNMIGCRAKSQQGAFQLYLPIAPRTLRRAKV